MRRTLLLGLLGVSVACGTIQACGGGNDTSTVDTDAGENGSVDHDATAGNDATGGEDAAPGNDATSNQDTGTGDAGNEDASDAGDAGDAAPVPCTGTDTACTTGNGQAGLCKSGFCAACVDPTDDTACTSAYGTDGGADASATSYVCAAGQCVAGNCHDSTTCAAGKVCVSNKCGGCSNDTQCTGDSRYGASTICSGDGGTCISNACTTVNTACASSASHFCCHVPSTVDGGADAGMPLGCVSGNCCDDTQCSGSTPVCANNTCTACDAHTGNTWVVDPVNGSDAETGSGTVGGVAHNRCAFKTITKAIQAINAAAAQPDGGPGTPAAGTKILVMGPATAATGETFPLALPENVTLEGSGTGVVISSTIGTAITATHPGAAITNVMVNGNGTTTTCIDATGGALTLNAVEVKGCTTGVHLANAAMVTAMAGTNVHNNTTGFRAQNTSSLILNSTTTPITVATNATAGVLVNDLASLTVTGDANSETVVFSGNGIGLWFNQNPAAGTLPTSAVSGLVAKNNTTAGIQLQGGSSIKLRNSATFGNVFGVNIIQSAVTNFENDTSSMDLGSDATGDGGVTANVGGNILQTQQASAGGTPNTGTGLCVGIQPNKSQTIRAKGNRWATSDKTGTVNCNTTAATIGSTATCTGGSNVGGSAATNGNSTLVDLCTL